MAVKVFLKPHTGIQEVDGKQYSYTHPTQWMVYFTDDEASFTGEKFIGYLPKPKGSPFLPAGSVFGSQPVALQELIVTAVGEAAGDPRPVGVRPLPPSALEVLPNGEEEEEDDIIVDE